MEKETEMLEATLREFKPAPVPAALEARILASFDNSSSVGKSIGKSIGKSVCESVGQPAAASNIARFVPDWRALSRVAAVLVAAVGVFFAALNSKDASQGNSAPLAGDADPLPTKRTFIPIRAENVFEGARAGGVFLNTDQTPVQKVRYQFSETFVWKNPTDGTLIEVTLPREKLFLVPVRTD